MRVLILGGDGYLGWPTAMRFSGKGHDVAIVDNFNRRRWVEEQGGDSLTPIASLDERVTRLARGVGQDDRDPHRRHRRGHVHRRRRARVRARHDHPLRRAAVRAVVDAVDRQRGRDPAGQRDRLAQAAVGDARVHPRRAPDQARHDGRVRHAEHRHRRGLHRDRAQRPHATCCRSRRCRVRCTTCPRCTTRTTCTSPAACGACARPTSTRASCTASRRPRPSSTTGC